MMGERADKRSPPLSRCFGRSGSHERDDISYAVVPGRCSRYGDEPPFAENSLSSGMATSSDIPRSLAALAAR